MDVISKPQTETEKLFAIDKPSLENLIYALRHPETWPKAFVWDYGECNDCAMGLAHRLWDLGGMPDDQPDGGVTQMARSFAMPYEVADQIFYGSSPDYPDTVEVTKGYLWWKTTDCLWFVTPEMVADQIDKYLARDSRS